MTCVGSNRRTYQIDTEVITKAPARIQAIRIHNRTRTACPMPSDAGGFMA